MWRAVLLSGIIATTTLEGARAEAEDPTKVSMVALIADPAGHEGRRVQVAGYVTTAHFEDCAIYLSRDDLDRGIAKNALRLGWSGCQGGRKQQAPIGSLLSGQFATVEGTFRAGSDLDRRQYSGVVDEVTTIRLIPSRAEFMKRNTMPFWQANRLELVGGLLFVALMTSAAAWISGALQARR